MSSLQDHFPILLIALPLVAAPLCVVLRQRRLTYALALVVSWITFFIAIAMMVRVHQSGTIRYEIGGWSPPYGIEYVVDAFSAFVIMFVSGIGAIALTYAPASLRDELPLGKHYLFHCMYCLCLAGQLGMCVTGDLFNVFVFLEISSLSSYALISLGNTRRAPLAALQYLMVGSIGATFVLIGIGLLYQLTGTLNMADIASRLPHEEGPRTVLVAIAFLSIGLFIKMAVFPLHAWLPNAYTYSPSVVTLFLAATATKVSVYVLVRVLFGIVSPKFVFETLPLDTELLFLSVVGIYGASIAAIYQDNVKRLLAYSSVAQIGYMLLGVSMATTAGLTGGITHMFNHALVKGGLFMVVGCFALRLGSVRLVDWRGAGRVMPWTAFACCIGGLGLIGIPLTAGFVSKWILLTGAVDAGLWPVAVLMLLSSLLAIVYVWRVIETLYFYPPSPPVVDASEAPLSMLIPTYMVIGGVVLFGCWTEWSAGLAAEAAQLLIEATSP